MAWRYSVGSIAGASVLLLAVGCRPHQQPTVIDDTPPTVEREQESLQPTPATGLAAHLRPQQSPDLTNRAEVLALAVRGSRVGIPLLMVGYRAENIFIAAEANGPTQIWIDGDGAWDSLMGHIGPGLLRYDDAVPVAKVDGRLIATNIALERLNQGSIWAGIAAEPEIAAGDRGPERTAQPSRPQEVPADAVAWLRLGPNESATRISWPTTTYLWLTREGPEWRIVLRFQETEDLAWLIRDRAKAVAGELSDRFGTTESIYAAHAEGATQIEGRLSDAGLDTAWALLLEVGRTGTLPPVQPVVLQTSPTTYVVRISDLQRWQLFDWLDVAVKKMGDGVWLRNVGRSPLQLLGIGSGVVIQKINGADIRAAADIEAAVFSAIEQHLPAIEVEARRGRTPLTLRYELVP